MGSAQLIGVVNVTPDSFSDGGEFLDAARPIEHGRALVREGADIVDVGGESTRPGGAGEVSAEQELARVAPVLDGLVGVGVAISIDTSKAEVAEASIDAGATIVNDITALRADPELAALRSLARCPSRAIRRTRTTWWVCRARQRRWACRRCRSRSSR